MRILTRRIYRAFPELDRYSDERCVRFVEAAAGSRRRRFGRFLLSAVIGALPALVLFGGGAVVDKVVGRKDHLLGTGAAWAIGIGAVMIVLWPLFGYLSRDFLLRCRVRHILRARGTCAGCKYSLIGVPVPPATDDGCTVTCPECGLECEVDPALGELVVNELGQRLFAPTPAAIKTPRVFTARRVRFLKRVVIWGCVALFLGAPAMWGGYELFLRRQASVARTERIGSKGLLQAVEAAQPKNAGPESPDAWESFTRALQIVDTVDASTWRAKAPTTSAGTEVYPDFSMIMFEPGENRTSAEREYDLASANLAEELLVKYREAGAFSALDELASRRRAVRPINIAPNQPMISVLLPELGKARNFARMNGARMLLAAKSGDMQEYVSAYESNLALARILHSQPFLIDGLVAVAIEALAYSRLRPLLATHPDPTWLDAIQGAMDRQLSSRRLEQMLESERLVALDTVAYTFSDPANVRFGQFSKNLRGITGFGVGGTPDPTKRVGTYESNKRAFNRYFDDAVTAAAKPRWQRSATAAFEVESPYVLVNTMLPAFDKAMSSYDQNQLDRDGTMIMIALEKFRHATGEYPEALAELEPEFLKVVPKDPWSAAGGVYGYHRVGAATDPQQRGYILYSAAADGKDNGGNTPAGTANKYWMLLSTAGPPANGYDFILNDRSR